MNVAAYRYRFYPNADQADLLIRTFGCIRFVYNRARAMRETAWQNGQQRCGLRETKAMLPVWKREPALAWLKEVSAVPLQQAMFHLDRAYQNFFAKRARYPRFRRKSDRQTAEFTRGAFRIRNGEIWLPKMDQPLDVRWHRSLPVEPSTVTVVLEPDGCWYIACRVLVEPKPLRDRDDHIGVDFGLLDLVTLSTGEKIENPRHLKKRQKRLARDQRRFARKQKGSRNRAKAKRKVARQHSRIHHMRQDFLHKLTTRLVRENQAITVESLSIRNMVKNRRLARSILDVAWGEIVRQLRYKCLWYGRTLVELSRFFPGTKTCSTCGVTGHRLALSDRTWTCPDCGAVHDRDHNAATNHRLAGERALEAAGWRHQPAERRSDGVPLGEPHAAVKQEPQAARPGSPHNDVGIENHTLGMVPFRES